MNWSEYQQAIFSHCSSNPASLSVQAVAGSGKTTTMCEAGHGLKSEPLNLAFNKNISEELKSRGVNARTFNSHGYGECREHSIYKTDFRKIQNICKDRGVSRNVAFNTDKLISYAMSHCFRDPTPSEFFVDIMPHVEFEEEDMDADGYSAFASEIIQQTVKDFSCVTFDEQLYFPWYHKWFFHKEPFIFVDEAQDLNPLQHEYIEMMKPDKVVAFGDHRQAIYAFRGADSQSMKNLADRFSMEHLPLTVSYRCPLDVIEIAKQYCPELEPAPGAEKGFVTDIPVQKLMDGLAAYPTNTMILCRNNAPLFSVAASCLARKIPFRFRGNFAKTLSFLIYKFRGKNTSINELMRKIIESLEKDIKLYENRRWHARARHAEDKLQCLRILSQDAKDPDDMLRAIEKIGKGDRGIILSTIHQSKGLESPNVFFLEPDLIELDEEQERNLYYVAVTRSMQNLVFV